MFRINSLVVVLAVVFAGALVIAAEEAATESKPIKLVQPWSKLTTLTPEQVGQISDIHQKANAEIKAIKEKEEADILALLNDAQKAELQKLEEARKAEMKAKRAAMKEGDQTPKTEPADQD